MATKVVTNRKTSFDADTNNDNSVDFNVGNASDNTQRVILASDQPAITTKPRAGTTSGVDSVTVGAASTAILASNASRTGALIYNSHASDTLYITWGEAATTSKFPVLPQGWFNIPDWVTEAVNGIRGSTNDITVLVSEGTAS